MDVDEQKRRAHLNLVDSSRQLFELDSGAVVEANEGWLLGAGTHDHPTITNAAFRRDDGVDPGDLLDRAREFFGERGRGFSLWTRDVPEDEDLVKAAGEKGLKPVYEMPQMVCERRAEDRPLPPEAGLRRVASRREAEDFWKLTGAAYVSLGFPPEVFEQYDDYAGLLADDLAAFIAYLDGRPVSAGMTIVNHGVAGIYWVGTLEEARGKGLAWATTAAATNAGFEMGAELASLQASHMGQALYEAMGYETIYRYRLFMAAAP